MLNALKVIDESNKPWINFLELSQEFIDMLKATKGSQGLFWFLRVKGRVPDEAEVISEVEFNERLSFVLNVKLTK